MDIYVAVACVWLLIEIWLLMRVIRQLKAEIVKFEVSNLSYKNRISALEGILRKPKPSDIPADYTFGMTRAGRRRFLESKWLLPDDES